MNSARPDVRPRQRFGFGSSRESTCPVSDYSLSLSSPRTPRRFPRFRVHDSSQGVFTRPYYARPDEGPCARHRSARQGDGHPRREAVSKAEEDFVTVALRDHGGQSSFWFWKQLEEERVLEEARLVALENLHRQVLQATTEDGVSSRARETLLSQQRRKAPVRQVKEGKKFSRESQPGCAGRSLGRCPSSQNVKGPILPPVLPMTASLERTGGRVAKARRTPENSLSVPCLNWKELAEKLDDMQSYIPRKKLDSVRAGMIFLPGEGLPVGSSGSVHTCVPPDLITRRRDDNQKNLQYSMCPAEETGSRRQRKHKRGSGVASPGECSSTVDRQVQENGFREYGHLERTNDLGELYHVGIGLQQPDGKLEFSNRGIARQLFDADRVGQTQFRPGDAGSTSNAPPDTEGRASGDDLADPPENRRLVRVADPAAVVRQPPPEYHRAIGPVHAEPCFPLTTVPTTSKQGHGEVSAPVTLLESSNRESLSYAKGRQRCRPPLRSYPLSASTRAQQDLRALALDAATSAMCFSGESVTEVASREPVSGGASRFTQGRGYYSAVISACAAKRISPESVSSDATLCPLDCPEWLSGAEDSGEYSEAVGQERLTPMGFAKAVKGAETDDGEKLLTTSYPGVTGEPAIFLGGGSSEEIPYFSRTVGELQDRSDRRSGEVRDSLGSELAGRKTKFPQGEKDSLSNAAFDSWLRLCTQDPLLQLPCGEEAVQLTPVNSVCTTGRLHVNIQLEENREGDGMTSASAPLRAFSQGALDRTENSRAHSAFVHPNQNTTFSRRDTGPRFTKCIGRGADARPSSQGKTRDRSLSLWPRMFPVGRRLNQSIERFQREVVQLVIRVGELKFSRRMGSQLRTSPSVFLCYSIPVAVPAMLAKEKTIVFSSEPSNRRDMKPRKAGRTKVTISEPLVEQELVIARPHTRSSLTFLFDKVSSHSLLLGSPSPATARSLRRTALFNHVEPRPKKTSERHPEIANKCELPPVLLDGETSAALLLQQPLRLLVCADVGGEPSVSTRKKADITCTCTEAFELKPARAPCTAGKQRNGSSVVMRSRSARTTTTKVRSCCSQTELLENWGWTHSFPASDVRVVAVGLCSAWNASLLKGDRQKSGPLMVRLYELQTAVSLSHAFNLSGAALSAADVVSPAGLVINKITENLQKRKKEELLAGKIELYIGDGFQGSWRKREIPWGEEIYTPEIRSGQPMNRQKATNPATDGGGAGECKADIVRRQKHRCPRDGQEGRKPARSGRVQRGDVASMSLGHCRAPQPDSEEQVVRDRSLKQDCRSFRVAPKAELGMFSAFTDAQGESISIVLEPTDEISPTTIESHSLSDRESAKGHEGNFPAPTSKREETSRRESQRGQAAAETIDRPVLSEKGSVPKQGEGALSRQTKCDARTKRENPDPSACTGAFASFGSSVLPGPKELNVVPEKEEPVPPAQSVPPTPHVVPQ
ncbi:hypothetical protein CSUI_003333 [Cystoisospora suis]|uniref:Uncharacterized protein n=1 Tax=Cystoisospora suis TaxID=483139 RepID=A0A2C6KFL0_9APIC|nr:hypothetical protein CSUI_003333 [Cystoisospora suis]